MGYVFQLVEFRCCRTLLCLRCGSAVPCPVAVTAEQYGRRPHGVSAGSVNSTVSQLLYTQHIEFPGLRES